MDRGFFNLALVLCLMIEAGASPIKSGARILRDCVKVPQPDQIPETESSSSKWERNTLPYILSTEFDNEDRVRISKAIKQVTSLTGVKFTKRSDETDYIRIVNGEGCWSFIGNAHLKHFDAANSQNEYGESHGGQRLSLQRHKCFDHETIFHILLHAVGFDHAHYRKVKPQHGDKCKSTFRYKLENGGPYGRDIIKNMDC